MDYPIADLIAERVRAMGVQPFYKRFVHNGVNGPNMATVYSGRGFGVRAPVVFYNRANEAAALLRPGDFDSNIIFAGGVRWFHSGGIFASLSETAGELDVIDRVGAGMASRPASSTGCSPTSRRSRPSGWAYGALLTTFSGDTTMASVDQVRAFATGGSARIQR